TKTPENGYEPLTSEDLEYMASFPHILEITSANLGNFYVVHAGLNASLTLEEQNPNYVFSVERKSGREIRDGSTQDWFVEWNERQTQLRDSPGSQPYTVIYGHDAALGLQDNEYSIGLDTGCAKGKSLTGVVFPDRKFYSVNCEKPQNIAPRKINKPSPTHFKL
ncbi:hypothetical protein IWQ62_004842, partial [Dispira parvispora]